jgi:phosphatidate cytidylyltransferase
MKLRIATGLLLIPPVLYLAVWAPWWLFLAALLVVVTRTAYEYFRLSSAAGLESLRGFGYIGCAAACLAQVGDVRLPATSGFNGATVLPVTILLVVLGLTAGLILTPDVREYLRATCSSLFVIFYVGLMLSTLVPLRFSPAVEEDLSAAIPQRYILVLLFGVIWAGDACAYFVGRGLGRHHLFPKISPKKTVEGSLGGLAGSMLLAWALGRWWHTSNIWIVMLLAALAAVAGQAGDLVESALKRSADLKDSGALLPGHGGLLDRIDSLIFAAPVVWLVLVAMHLWHA